MNKIYFYYQYASNDALTRRTSYAKLEDATHMIRDTEIYTYMILQDIYEYGKSILNIPPKPFKRKTFEIPLDKFDSSDLILLQTRPPVLSQNDINPEDPNDFGQEMEQRHITITGQNLEQIILNNLRQSLFDRCGRKSIKIKKRVFEKNEHSRFYNPEFQFVEFFISPRRCWIEKMGTSEDMLNKQKDQFTLGFIIYLPQLFDGVHTNLPGFLNIFSIGGTASILFSLLVYQQYGKMVREMISSQQSRVVMVKFSFDFSKFRTSLPPFLESVPVEHEIVNDLVF